MRVEGSQAEAVLSLHEPYAHLYVGDYFADTMQLSAQEHRALRLLLLQTWMVHVITPEDDDALATMIGIPLNEWRNIKCSILPLLEVARLRIADTIKELR